MAVSSAFAGAKLESLLPCNASAAASPAPQRMFCKPARTTRAATNRGVWFNSPIKCEGLPSDVVVQSRTNAASVSSLSALEQLKTSAADSMFHFFLLACHEFANCFYVGCCNLQLNLYFPKFPLGFPYLVS